MTIQQAIRQARQDLSWHVTPNGTVQVTIRFADYAGKKTTVTRTLNSTDKERELVELWRESHDGLDAAIDSVLFVSTPRPF